MRAHYKLAMAVFFMAFLMQASTFAQQEVVVYGDRNYPPYSFVEEGKAKGIYVEILTSAFAQMEDYQMTIKMVPWKRGLDYIQKGRGFALFPPYQTEDRKPWMDFSVPILEERVVVYGKAEDLEGKTQWPEDFYGATFGLNLGFSHVALGGKKFEEACQTGKIKLQEANSTDQNLKKLKAGKIQFYINDRFMDISAYPAIKRGMVVTTNQGHLGFTKKDEVYGFASDFKTTFDAVIDSMKASGAIEKVVDEYVK